MIHVVATIELAPGTRGDFLAEFHRLMPDVRAEHGCIEYGPAIDADTDLSIQAKAGPNTVIVIEKWANVDALKAHLIAPHMQAYRARVQNYVRGVQLLVLDPAE